MFQPCCQTDKKMPFLPNMYSFAISNCVLQNEEYTVQDLKGLTAPYNRIFLDRGGIISLPLIIPG